MKTTTQTVTEVIDGDWSTKEGLDEINSYLVLGWTLSLAKRKLTKTKSVQIPSI